MLAMLLQGIGSMKYATQLLIAIDQLGNALLGGWADETISARAWRRSPHSKRWACARWGIDALFFWQEDHCMKAYEHERRRSQLPAEYRP
jgi:hypothetical protein